MSFLLSGKKPLLFGVILAFLIIIPLTVYLAQKQQETRSGAVAATTLSFSPSSQTTTVGQTISYDILLTPGSNQVAFAKLSINFDPEKLGNPALAQNTDNNNLQNVLEGPTYASGNALIILSVGADPANVLKTTTKIASISFKALAPTDTPTQITFSNETQILSIAAADTPSENVLKISSLTPATATITVLAPVTPTPTPTPGPAAIPTATPVPFARAGGAAVPGAAELAELTLTPSPISTITPTIAPSESPIPVVLPPVGPGSKIVGIGALGVVLSIIGGILFFAL